MTPKAKKIQVTSPWRIPRDLATCRGRARCRRDISVVQLNNPFGKREAGDAHWERLGAKERIDRQEDLCQIGWSLNRSRSARRSVFGLDASVEVAYNSQYGDTVNESGDHCHALLGSMCHSVSQGTAGRMGALAPCGQDLGTSHKRKRGYHVVDRAPRFKKL
jgi:hypothetical protein